jgi:hypothetical protein
MSEIIKHLKKLQEEQETVHKKNIEEAEALGAVLDSIGVKEALEQLNSEGLQGKGKVVNEQGPLPCVHEDAYHRTVPLRYTVYHPTSLRLLQWERASKYYWVGVISGIQIEDRICSIIGSNRGYHKNVSFKWGGFFCSENYGSPLGQLTPYFNVYDYLRVGKYSTEEMIERMTQGLAGAFIEASKTPLT